MIYLDNAATSWPKAPSVCDQMKYYLDCVGASINRGVYAPAQEVGLKTLTLREQLAAFFHHPDPNHVILTSGCTAALNLAIKGLLHPGDHVLVSSLEHNAVMRPLVQLGVAFDRVPCDTEGFLRCDLLEPLLRPNTKLVILNHASNVCGTVQNAEAVGRLCKLHGIPLLLDAAQSAGHVAVDFEAFGLSALAVPAHKGLLGPQGIGALLVTPEFAARLAPLLAGGTGSVSDSEEIPPYMPDRFEPGTPNLPGIFGWSAAMDYVNQIGLDELRRHEVGLTEAFLNGLAEIDGIRVAGTKDMSRRVGVIGVDFDHIDNAEAADRLEREFGILTRCGMHCAPAAHKALGTFPQGVVRFSVSAFTTESEIDAAINAVRTLAEER
ncbi:MAG: aminotransferase class V-fold PLP-dependent enzyme [Oscillospiraceae bacterium]|nr:aminotransferase class V-fold PLP-dependent enzyme [Oscillospiraceae bacterium]